MEPVHRPLATFRFRLTTVDALAYERLPGEWSGRRKLAFFLPLFAIGALAGLIEDWAAVDWWLAVAALLGAWAAIGLLVRDWLRRRRARSMAAREGVSEVEQWGDHLVVRSASGTRHIAWEMLGKVIVTEAHVFLLYAGGPTIVPLRAFGDAGAMRAFAEDVDRRSRDAVP